MSSGEPKAESDAFAFSDSEYHGFMHSLVGKHGQKCWKVLDEVLAVGLIGMLLLFKTSVVIQDLLNLTFERDLTSMGLVMFANDIIEWAIVVGASLMWHTFCYWNKTVHAFWKLKVWPLPSLMPGGFMPRLAAFSLGILMFTTSTIVSEGRVEGKSLQSKFGDDHWEQCRATDMDVDDAGNIWFSRLLRRPPSVMERSHRFNCFNTEVHGLLNVPASQIHNWVLKGFLKVTPLPFNRSDLDAFFDDQNASGNSTHAAENIGVEKPWNRHVGSLSTSLGFPMTMIDPWIAWIDNTSVSDMDFTYYGFHCMYQCTKWKSVGLMALIKNVGTIVAGSAVVVKTSDGLSKAFGGRFFKNTRFSFMLGLPLVNQDTDAKTIKEIIKATRAPPGKGRSKFWAALVCIFAMVPLRFASKLNIDGYFTVDYYVTAVFFSSLIMACMVRQFQPYKLMRIAYTEKMWAEGKDTFLDMEKHEFRELDLYEWIHLTQLARADHLLGYARLLTMDDIKAELKSQGDALKKLPKARKTAQAAEAAKGTEKAEKAEKEAKEALEAAKQIGPLAACNLVWPCLLALDDESEQAARKKLEEGSELAAKEQKAAADAIKKADAEAAAKPEAQREAHKNAGAKAAAATEAVKALRLVDMKARYYNKHAALLVKVIREISVSTTSPPVPNEFGGSTYSAGCVVSKVVVVRPNAVGTVVDRVGGDRIKIRIPKEVPKHVPLLGQSLPMVALPEDNKTPLFFPGTSIPVAITRLDYPDLKFEDKCFPEDVPAETRRKFCAAKNYVKERQYNMSLTPSPTEPEKHKVSHWFHNAVLRLLKPPPRHVQPGKDADDDDHEAKTLDEATKWEDVVVSLQDIIEASEEWREVELERSVWVKTNKIAASRQRDNKDKS